MPREIKNLKEFVLRVKSDEAKSVRIKKNKKNGSTKFKVRCKKYLYTFRVDEEVLAKKVEGSIPPGKQVERFA
ncbi:hypothetical protein NDN08_007701 [Rhodosorus marinus]|uniref:60S ribosomal protein L38 n=1 Tax=Rhodosorus marinus TaxID=101924 RepID=A0AAV8V141_9RHOD|nr:hypothetical protein NDN08_007701 [Rhodosorus marinus]